MGHGGALVYAAGRSCACQPLQRPHAANGRVAHGECAVAERQRHRLIIADGGGDADACGHTDSDDVADSNRDAIFCGDVDLLCRIDGDAYGVGDALGDADCDAHTHGIAHGSCDSDALGYAQCFALDNSTQRFMDTIAHPVSMR